LESSETQTQLTVKMIEEGSGFPELYFKNWENW